MDSIGLNNVELRERKATIIFLKTFLHTTNEEGYVRSLSRYVANLVITENHQVKLTCRFLKNRNLYYKHSYQLRYGPNIDM
jgi:hypothetical protein